MSYQLERVAIGRIGGDAFAHNGVTFQTTTYNFNPVFQFTMDTGAGLSFASLTTILYLKLRPSHHGPVQYVPTRRSISTLRTFELLEVKTQAGLFTLLTFIVLSLFRSSRRANTVALVDPPVKL
ncbi:hypothetical protein C8J56DRAFT_1045107 [Mycena floridula]|nr:hypothetical protein C8J56DRAFT_1045107 [Mycena floridula]